MNNELDNNAQTPPSVLENARQLFAEGKIEESLAAVKSYWLEFPEDSEAAALFSELMKESGRSELSKRLSSLAEQMPKPPAVKPQESNTSETKNYTSAQNPDTPETASTSHSSINNQSTNNKSTNNQSAPNQSTNPTKELFEAGYSLIDARQHELAAMLLNRAARLVPQEPTVNYELGFALMSMKRFEQAIPHLEQALDKSADFDTLLNLLVCYTLTRELGKAHEMLQKLGELAVEPEQKTEFAHRTGVLRRLETVRNKNKLAARDWLYILYGSILLRPTTREDKPKEDTHSIGEMLAILKGILDGLSAMPEVIESYGAQSRPLAQALGEFLEVPISTYKGPERQEQALLTMTWASDIIGPHKTFTTKEKNRGIFSYGLTWDEPLPVVPEIIGCLAHDEPMPWNENTPIAAAKTAAKAPATNQRNFTPELEKTYKAILASARDLESDPKIIKAVQEALDFYDNKRQHLVLCNPDGFATRSEYTAEIID